MASVNTDRIVVELKDYFITDEMVALLEALKNGGVLAKITTGIAIVMEGVKAVEQIAIDLADLGISGSEKKRALVKFLDDCVDVPFFLEPLDGIIIGMAIDGIVAYYNAKLGHGWIDVVKKFLI